MAEMLTMKALPVLRPNFDRIPEELRRVPRWVTWRGAKVPMCPTSMHPASATDPDTWGSFQQAQSSYEEGDRSGVGFVLSGDGIVGIDLDKCVSNGSPDERALALLDRLGARYVELSPSGTGLRAFGRGQVFRGRRAVVDGIKTEIYSQGRYLTVTGHTVSRGPLAKLEGLTAVLEGMQQGSHLQKGQKMTEVPSESSVSSVGDFRADCLPTHEGQRNHCLFNLARWLKGAQPDATIDELRVIVQHWHAVVLPVIGSKDFAASWGDFMRSWHSVKHPHGETMTKILESINPATPLPAGIERLSYGDGGRRLIMICRALQQHADAAPFFLSARQAGELIGQHYTEASKMLCALVADGVLQLTSKGSGKIASRYRWIWPGDCL